MANTPPPIAPDAPPRPKRADFPDDKAYRRAYGAWRDKYDPNRIAARNARSRAYYAKNRDGLLADKRLDYAERTDVHKERQAAWRDANRDKLRHRDAVRYESNCEEMKAASAQYRADNPEKVRAMRAAYYAENKEALNAASREYSRKNRGKINARLRETWAEDPSGRKERNQAWAHANLDKIVARQRKWVEANPDKRRAYHQKWAEKNWDRILVLARLYDRRVRHATPPWLTSEHWKQIEAFYIEAQALTKATGVPHAVDHIDPLKGKNSCGLHVPWNLQVITKSANSRKRNTEPLQ